MTNFFSLFNCTLPHNAQLCNGDRVKCATWLWLVEIKPLLFLWKKIWHIYVEYYLRTWKKAGLTNIVWLNKSLLFTYRKLFCGFRVFWRIIGIGRHTMSKSLVRPFAEQSQSLGFCTWKWRSVFDFSWHFYGLKLFFLCLKVYKWSNHCMSHSIFCNV